MESNIEVNRKLRWMLIHISWPKETLNSLNIVKHNGWQHKYRTHVWINDGLTWHLGTCVWMARAQSSMVELLHVLLWCAIVRYVDDDVWACVIFNLSAFRYEKRPIHNNNTQHTHTESERLNCICQYDLGLTATFHTLCGHSWVLWIHDFDHDHETVE